jgi:hypothetical protein
MRPDGKLALIAVKWWFSQSWWKLIRFRIGTSCPRAFRRCALAACPRSGRIARPGSVDDRLVLGRRVGRQRTRWSVRRRARCDCPDTVAAIRLMRPLPQRATRASWNCSSAMRQVSRSLTRNAEAIGSVLACNSSRVDERGPVSGPSQKLGQGLRLTRNGPSAPARLEVVCRFQ